MLFLVMLLVSRMLSSLAGIKLKRLNHRQRMMDISKRVRGWHFGWVQLWHFGWVQL